MPAAVALLPPGNRLCPGARLLPTHSQFTELSLSPLPALSLRFQPHFLLCFFSGDMGAQEGRPPGHFLCLIPADCSFPQFTHFPTPVSPSFFAGLMYLVIALQDILQSFARKLLQNHTFILPYRKSGILQKLRTALSALVAQS